MKKSKKRFRILKGSPPPNRCPTTHKPIKITSDMSPEMAKAIRDFNESMKYPLRAGKYSYKKVDKGDYIEYHRPTHLKGSGEVKYRVNKKNPNFVERWFNPPLTNYTIKHGRHPKWERMPGMNHQKLVDSINKDIDSLNRH